MINPREQPKGLSLNPEEAYPFIFKLRKIFKVKKCYIIWSFSVIEKTRVPVSCYSRPELFAIKANYGNITWCLT